MQVRDSDFYGSLLSDYWYSFTDGENGGGVVFWACEGGISLWRAISQETQQTVKFSLFIPEF